MRLFSDTISSNNSLNDCVLCTPYIALFAIFLVASIVIYFHWYLKESNGQLCLKKDTVGIKLNPSTETKNY